MNVEPLREGVDAEAFFRRLREKGMGLLLLDYDGTLAPFREVRHEARPWPGIRERLDRIRSAGGPDPVIISGRPAREVAELLGADPHPEIWGCHGWEHRSPEGELRRVEPVPEAVEGLQAAHREATGLAPAHRVEHKGAAVAVHFRGMGPEEARELEARISRAWTEIVQEVPALELRPFDGGLEVRAGARDKGSAVRELLGRRRPDTPLAYLGDDWTDEDAFKAVRDAGGLAVLVRTELRPTEADLRLRPPGELLAFLDRWAEALAEDGP